MIYSHFIFARKIAKNVLSKKFGKSQRFLNPDLLNASAKIVPEIHATFHQKMHVNLLRRRRRVSLMHQNDQNIKSAVKFKEIR